jgi:multidrug efflux system outer membrane protein
MLHPHRICFKSLAVSVYLALVGCGTSVELYTSPDLNLPEVPAGVSQQVLQKDWWLVFEDPVLNTFVNESLKHNWDLVKASANVAQARENLAGAQALTSPNVNVGINYSASRRKFGTGTTEAEFNKVTRTVTANLALGWEMDIWGRIEHMNDAAKARFFSSELMREAMQLSVASLVVDAYFQLRTLQNKLQAMQEFSENVELISSLELRRWKSGLGTEFAYRQTEIDLMSAKSNVLLLQEAISKSSLVLQTLLGRYPRDISLLLPLTDHSIQVTPAPHVLDTKILLRRPDVASAEWALRAAFADVNATRAERYPRLGLSIIGGLVSSSSTWVSGTPSWLDTGLASSVPLTDGGLNASKVNAGIARRDYAKAQYHQAVLQAYTDLYQAVLEQNTSDEQVSLVTNELALRKQMLSFTQKSQSLGRVSQYEVYLEKLKVLQLQVALSDAKQAQWLSRSHFFKAIGGGI